MNQLSLRTAPRNRQQTWWLWRHRVPQLLPGEQSFLYQVGNCLKWQVLRLACFVSEGCWPDKVCEPRSSHCPMNLVATQQRQIFGMFFSAVWLKRLVSGVSHRLRNHISGYFSVIKRSSEIAESGSNITKSPPYSFISFCSKSSKTLKKPQTTVWIMTFVWTCQHLPRGFFIRQSAPSRWGRWAIRKWSFKLHSH